MEDLSDLRVMPNTAIFGDGLKVERIIEKLKGHFLENGSSIISLSVAAVNGDDNLFFSNPIKRVISQLKASIDANTQRAIFIKLEHEVNDESIQGVTSDICKLLDSSKSLNARIIVNFKETFELDEELSKGFEFVCFGNEWE